MNSDDGEKKRSAASRAWMSITGFLAFVAALGKAFEALPKMVLGENQRWIMEFLPGSGDRVHRDWIRSAPGCPH